MQCSANPLGRDAWIESSAVEKHPASALTCSPHTVHIRRVFLHILMDIPVSPCIFLHTRCVLASTHLHTLAYSRIFATYSLAYSCVFSRILAYLLVLALFSYWLYSRIYCVLARVYSRICRVFSCVFLRICRVFTAYSCVLADYSLCILAYPPARVSAYGDGYMSPRLCSTMRRELQRALLRPEARGRCRLVVYCMNTRSEGGPDGGRLSRCLRVGILSGEWCV